MKNRTVANSSDDTEIQRKKSGEKPVRGPATTIPKPAPEGVTGTSKKFASLDYDKDWTNKKMNETTIP